MELFNWLNWPTKHQNKETHPSGQPARRDSKEDPPAGRPGMNGAVEVRRPDSSEKLTTVQFGSGSAEMLYGYCHVSKKNEPCTWRILPISDEDPNPAKVRIDF
ncbi:Unknown protein [Striga hermonthica]|uniref:Uncharacterized protein n=1 Tax=Striga hermonthica TaxID=68872 RepID=A0A9N7RPA6_STRHE|nr:Unknown protein [Striga hermonthica]